MGSPSASDVIGLSDTQNLSFSDRLSVNGVPARRSKAPVMSGGVAAYASSDMFKTPVCIHYLGKLGTNLTINQGYGKPKANRWDRTVVLNHGSSETRKPC